jgi:16S rRNA (guanine(966)-N(2))-methyltransferase RsmD
MMRIITGKAKGIKLKTLEGEATRPTAERVKEALFSMMQGELEGREVLDLFSGSGQLALEALSRGAAHAYLVDSSAAAIKVLSANAEKTRLSADCTLVKDDYLSFIKENRTKKFDIIFLDPPYASGYYTVALRALNEHELLKPTTLVVCESDTDDVVGGDTILKEAYETLKQSRYGRTYITILLPRS